MTTPQVETCILDWCSRLFPASTTVEMAQMLEASGVVDYMAVWDGLSGPWPKHLWNPESVPAAVDLPGDLQSYHDPWVKLGLAAAAAPTLGLILGGTNGIRPGPAEVMRGMLTLASASSGKFIGTVAAGEAYNTVPFGYKRSEGLRRLEDHLKLYELLWECDGPFDFKGNFWEFTAADIGLVRTHKPTIWVEGAGPKLLDLGARYADGWMSILPHFTMEPEVYARQVKEIKDRVEAAGRDPESFGFGAYMCCVISEDDAAVDRLFESDFMRFMAALWGVKVGSDWRLLGFEPPISDDFRYSLHYLPNLATPADTKKLIDHTSPEMARQTTFVGSAKEVAGRLQEFADAGMNVISVLDYSAAMVRLEEMPTTMANQLEVCRILKGKSS